MNSSSEKKRKCFLRGGPPLRKGFTLVELSLVILVLSVLFSMMFGIYFSVSNIIKESRKTLTDKSSAVLALENIRSTIAMAYYNENSGRLVFFGRNNGSDDERNDVLTLAASQPGTEEIGLPEIREVSFYLDKETGSLMKREDMHVDEDPGQGGSHHVLLTDVLSLAFFYSPGTGEWFDTWSTDRNKRLPLLVRIQLKVKIGPRTEVFETMAATNTGRRQR